MLQVSIANNGGYSEITSFYLGVGYSCQLHESDLVIQARENGEVVGAVRLCQEKGKLVLRGMYVSEAKRGSGIGTALLRAASDEISHRECWCIPYTYLTQLYGRAGFEEAPKYAEPRFLLDRLARYSRKGKSVVLLVRPANWRVIA
jgi:N-acetylglutamate synthase-like GNAT family acetyltransferase